MDATIQKILEQSESVEWEGKQDATTAMVSGIVGIIIMVVVGVIFYKVGGSTTGTCTVNGVTRPISECAGYARIASYVFFALAVLTPIFTYWRYKVTNYIITGKRLIIKSGFVGADIVTLYYDQVRNIFVNVGVLGKIFSTGSIMIDTGKMQSTNNKSGNSTQVVYDRFDNIKNPYDVYKKMQEKLSANKSALYSGKGV